MSKHLHKGTAGDKSPATNYTERGTTRQVVDAAPAIAKNATFTSQLLSERGSRPGGSKGETPMIPRSNAIKTA